MRTAIISDIHGNLEALSSVLQDIDGNVIDSIVCLGDLVGYGSQPEEVVQKIRDLEMTCVLGNHDLAIFDDNELTHFEAVAAQSIEFSRELLSKESMSFLKTLPPNFRNGDALFVHGSPEDSVTKYIFELDEDELIEILQSLTENVVFVGHLHMLLKYELSDGVLLADYLNEGKMYLDKNKRYIFNAGSVGQPRDGTPHAKYAIFDDAEYSLELRFVPYDVLKTVSLIAKSRFGNSSGARLIKGK